MDKFYTVPEVAEKLRLGEDHLYKLCREGGFPHTRITGKAQGKIVISEDDIKEWFSMCREQTQKAAQ